MAQEKISSNGLMEIWMEVQIELLISIYLRRIRLI
ncbi:Uncharacterised protein [Vibrio cholerae]|nr:Uncharacterised protein [Vibrio cholerae]